MMTSFNAFWIGSAWRKIPPTEIRPMRLAASCALMMCLLALSGCGGESDDQADGAVNVAAAPAAPQADAEYAALLTEIADDRGWVQYNLLRDETRAAMLHRAIERMANAPLPEDPKARLALQLNAYNANVLEMAFQESIKPGFTNVKAVPGFFNSRRIKVAGTETTLDGLRDSLRALGDPRIHGALVVGAVSGAPLRDEPFMSARLDQQLDHQCRRWIEENSRNTPEMQSLALNDFFKTFEEDFKVPPYGDSLGFIKAFAHPNGTLRSYLRTNTSPNIRWVPFDWRLNETPKGLRFSGGDGKP